MDDERVCRVFSLLALSVKGKENLTSIHKMPVFGGLGQTATKKQQKIRALWLAFKKQPPPQKGQGSFLWASL